MHKLLPQALPLADIKNARQLGGYVTASGQRIKANALLRSGRLTTAGPESLGLLSDHYRLSCVVDFRTEVEVAANPDRVPKGATHLHLDVVGHATGDMAASVVQFQSGNMVDVAIGMVKRGQVSRRVYIELLGSPSAREAFRGFFEALLDYGNKGAVLWHCTAGKDRTGVATALLLGALGVDDDTIVADFDLTNRYLAPDIDHVVQSVLARGESQAVADGTRALAGVDPEALRDMLLWLDERYGSIVGFLQRELGLMTSELALLKRMYLEA